MVRVLLEQLTTAERYHDARTLFAGASVSTEPGEPDRDPTVADSDRDPTNAETIEPSLVPSSDAAPTAPTDPEGILGLRVGGYLLQRFIAGGGMGYVYEAEQAAPRRTVALKVLRPGVATKRMLRRFEYEAEILGRLDHPGIAKVLEAGSYDTGQGPQPWFAMELVPNARTLLQHADQNGLSRAQRLALFARVYIFK